MGLLDDAIREHLELKRKHGADPADVARQEQEALGPGRQFAPAEPEPPLQEDEPESPAAVQAEPPADDLPEGEPGIQEEPPAAEAPGYEEDPWLDEERDEVPADESLEPPRGEEDVLEETPDFLQETPEHDRLWFEQKPPRDFDWDK
jgi:hypothetical protein